MKTKELDGRRLDAAVAIALGSPPPKYDTIASWWVVIDGEDRALSTGWSRSMNFAPSVYWENAGPIIEREGILLRPLRRAGHPMDGQWLAMYDGSNTGTLVRWVNREDFPRHYWSGPTPLIAAMRCFVTSKLGDEVDIPERLT